MRSLGRGIVAGASLAAALLVGPLARAQAPLPRIQPVRAITQQTFSKPNVMVVVDNSGSMQWVPWSSAFVGNDCFNGASCSISSSTSCPPPDVLSGGLCYGCPDPDTQVLSGTSCRFCSTGYVMSGASCYRCGTGFSLYFASGVASCRKCLSGETFNASTGQCVRPSGTTYTPSGAQLGSVTSAAASSVPATSYAPGTKTSSRMAIVKDALKAVLPQINSTVNLGLFSYQQTGYSYWHTNGWTGWVLQAPSGTAPCPANHFIDYTLTNLDANGDNKEYALTLCKTSSTGNAITATTPGNAPDSVIRLYDQANTYLGAENDNTSTPYGLYTNCSGQAGSALAASSLYYDPAANLGARICMGGKTAASDGAGTLSILAKKRSQFTASAFYDALRAQSPAKYPPACTASSGLTCTDSQISAGLYSAPASLAFSGQGACSLTTVGGATGKQATWTRVGSTTTLQQSFGLMTGCAWARVATSGSYQYALRCKSGTISYDLKNANYACWQAEATFTTSVPAQDRQFPASGEGTPYSERGATFTDASGTDWAFPPLSTEDNYMSSSYDAGAVRVRSSVADDPAVQAAKLSSILSWMEDGADGGLIGTRNTPIGPTLYYRGTSPAAGPANSIYHYYQCLEAPSCASLPSYCSGSGITCDNDAHCRDNYVLFMTDGEPTAPYTDASNCSSATCRTNPRTCNCSATAAAYDLLNGDPSVKTFMVGFGGDLQTVSAQNTLRNIAKAGGTCRDGADDFASCVYAASDTPTLVAALKDAFKRISGQYSTSPVSTATGAQATTSSNYALLTYTSFPAWEGNLVSYDLLSPNLDSEGRSPQYFSAGDVLKNRAWCSRQVFSWNVTSSTIHDTLGRHPDYPPNTAIPLSTWSSGTCSPSHANAAALLNLVNQLKIDGIVPASFNFPAPDQEAQARDMIRFMLGDPTSYGKAVDASQWKLGPILHSTPVAIGKSPEDTGRFVDRPGVAYVGTTHGLLHAFWLENDAARNRTAGDELFAFAPPAQLSKLYAIFAAGGEPPKEADHIFGVATSGHVSDVCTANCATDPTWRTLFFFGVGVGGKEYYALDITHVTAADGSTPARFYCTSTTDTRCVGLRWSTDDKVDYGDIRAQDNLQATYDPLLGETWSVPAISNLGSERVVITGSGYGASGEQGEHLVVMKASTGELLEKRRVGGGAPLVPTVAYGLVPDIPLVKVDPTNIGETPSNAVIADPAGRIHFWAPQLDPATDNAPTLIRDFGTTKPFLYSPAAFYKQSTSETIIAAATSSYDLDEGAPETYLYVLQKRGANPATLITSRKISDLCKSGFKRDMDSATYCSGTKFRSTTRIISSPKILINSNITGQNCTSDAAQNSGSCVLQAAFPVYEPPVSGCEAGNSYLVILEAVLFPSLSAQHAMTIDLGDRLRSSGFTVGAGGQALIVGGTGGATPAIRGSGGVASFRGTRKIGWREL